MAESATLGFTWGRSGETLSGSVVLSSDNGVESDIDLINGVVTADIEILTAGLKGIFMLSDKAVSVVAKDSGGTTVQTIALAANHPYAWTYLDPAGPSPNPFGSDIETFVCTASLTGTLKVRVIQDSTP